MLENVTEENPSSTQEPTLSKNATKKLAKLELIKSRRKEERARKKLQKQNTEKTLDPNPDRICKRDRIFAEKEKLRSSLAANPKVVIDCSYESQMSAKEINKTRMQILRCYHLLKSSEKLFHLHLGEFKPDSSLAASFAEKTPGFDDMCITAFPDDVHTYFDKSNIIYLTPDAEHALEDVSPDCVYVIGGFVDDNIKRYSSLHKCNCHQIKTARLPIPEYFGSVNHKQCVLTINQVFEILLLVYNGEDWLDVLLKLLPKRKGYELKSLESKISNLSI